MKSYGVANLILSIIVAINYVHFPAFAFGLATYMILNAVDAKS